MTNTHIRLNRATREWVIYAPGRRIRPHEMLQNSPVKEPDAGNPAQNCPFCKKVDETSEIVLLEIKGEKGESWKTRVVRNKFPAL